MHGQSPMNGEFNDTQKEPGAENSHVFAFPEVMVKVKCDIHGWMSSWVGIVDHPYFAVTGKDGAWRLPNLPPGEYEIEAWHETHGRKTQTVKVSDKTEEVTFTFEGKK